VHSDFLNADLQKVFANKLKWVQACIDACGHHFQQLLSVDSDFLNTLYNSILGISRFVGKKYMFYTKNRFQASRWSYRFQLIMDIKNNKGIFIPGHIRA
jgi:hypothetical protein